MNQKIYVTARFRAREDKREDMIDLMVETIQAEHHKFRIMLPDSIVTWCKDYQKKMREEEI